MLAVRATVHGVQPVGITGDGYQAAARPSSDSGTGGRHPAARALLVAMHTTRTIIIS